MLGGGFLWFGEVSCIYLGGCVGRSLARQYCILSCYSSLKGIQHQQPLKWRSGASVRLQMLHPICDALFSGCVHMLLQHCTSWAYACWHCLFSLIACFVMCSSCFMVSNVVHQYFHSAVACGPAMQRPGQVPPDQGERRQRTVFSVCVLLQFIPIMSGTHPNACRGKLVHQGCCCANMMHQQLMDVLHAV